MINNCGYIQHGIIIDLALVHMILLQLRRGSKGNVQLYGLLFGCSQMSVTSAVAALRWPHPRFNGRGSVGSAQTDLVLAPPGLWWTQPTANN